MGARTKGRKPNRQGRAKSSARRLVVDVDRGEPAWTALGDLDAGMLVAEVAAALAGYVPLPAESTTAALSLGSDAEVHALNKQWRDQDKPTNVLSFASITPVGGAAEAERFIGDVILAEETLVREAAAQGIAVADRFRHLVLHGLLHLLGFDHVREADAVAMEALETRILGEMGVADPYDGTEPVATRPSPPVSAGRS